MHCCCCCAPTTTTALQPTNLFCSPALSGHRVRSAARLTPVTGCPSLSSTEDDEDSASGQLVDAGRLAGSGYLAGGIGQLAGSRDALNTIKPSRMSGQHRASFAAGDLGDSSLNNQLALSNQANVTSRAAQSRYLQQTPTKISITAPSPMGSVRDMSALISANQQEPSSQAARQAARYSQPMGASSSAEAQMIERMNELSMSGPGYDSLGDLNPTEHNNNNHISNQRHHRSASVLLGQSNEHQDQRSAQAVGEEKEQSRSQLIDELLKTINDDSFNDLVDFNNKFAAQTSGNNANSNSSQQLLTAAQLANANRPKSAMDSTQIVASNSGASNYASGSSSLLYKQQNSSNSGPTTNRGQQTSGHTSNSARTSSMALGPGNQTNTPLPSTFDNVIRRMSTNFVQNFNKMSNSTLANFEPHDSSNLRREKSSQQQHQPTNSLYVDNQVPTRRHSDNTINIPRIQVAPSSPAGSRACGLNQRASVSASKLANKWKLTAKGGKKESSDKLSPNLSGALGYMRRHSSGNTTGNDRSGQSNGQASNSLLNASPFKVSH